MFNKTSDICSVFQTLLNHGGYLGLTKKNEIVNTTEKYTPLYKIFDEIAKIYKTEMLESGYNPSTTFSYTASILKSETTKVYERYQARSNTIFKVISKTIWNIVSLLFDLKNPTKEIEDRTEMAYINLINTIDKPFTEEECLEFYQNKRQNDVAKPILAATPPVVVKVFINNVGKQPKKILEPSSSSSYHHHLACR